MDFVPNSFSYQGLSIYEIAFKQISRTGVIVQTRKSYKWNNIDARVTDLVHGTTSHQGLFIYEVSFQKYKEKLSYYKMKRCDGKRVKDRTDRQTGTNRRRRSHPLVSPLLTAGDTKTNEYIETIFRQ